MITNNDLLNDIANMQQKSGLTNNQLLKLIALNLINDSQIIQQPAIQKLDENASESDIWQKVNEIIDTLEASKLTQQED